MRLYSIGEIAYRLGGVSKEKIKSLEERGYVTPQRVGRRGDRLFTMEDLERIEEILKEEKK